MKRVIKELLKRASARLPEVSFTIRFWDGETAHFGKDEPHFFVDFKTKDTLRSILGRGSTGFREEYVSGNIDISGDLQAVMRLGAGETIQGMELSPWMRLTLLVRCLCTRNSLRKSPENIARHYDLGNDFYRQWLDESMTYSCAYFKSESDSLEQAQQQKYEHICRKLMLSEGDNVVDVGCGWGGFLVYASRKFGIRGVGCTLSREQADYAKDLIATAGLGKRIDILLEDYRRLKGRFDKFVSIGMFEHVGKGFIPTFMEKTKHLLKPGGIGLLHSIGKERASAGDPWTLGHIFPGGYIPVLDEIVRAMGARGLIPIDIENLRLHYAATLDEWARRFEMNAEGVRQHFGEGFARTWRMYLNGCAAVFRWGDLRLYQIAFTNGVNNSLPLTRDYLYRTT
ncbi:MAG TPA: SAM-dependent methyltransferase [Deltaproteobacteria bacterium]|nr:SAM-dependent methyltransferase [Deltaproteobacteria bacterium]